MGSHDKITVKVASVSLNQTVYDWARNIRNILLAIGRAVEDGADILSTEELSLVGYPADDYHQWNHDNELVWQSLAYIAAYAAQKDPNLVVTVGAPWHYANRAKRADDPEYNINNKPYNAHVVITGGRVVAMAAKSILADGPAEYEPRQFAAWPKDKQTVLIELPDGSFVPFGKPVISLFEGRKRATLAFEICAEAWPGLGQDLRINDREQTEARYLVELAQSHDLSVVLNPSASKPEPSINKERLRGAGICQTGSAFCGLYVYTNYLGSASGSYGAEGSQLFAQNNKIIHHGCRYSFKDMSYSSVVVEVDNSLKGDVAVSVPHRFNAKADDPWQGAEASFDLAHGIGLIDADQLAFEEYMRSIALWLRDYLMKQRHEPQGYVISLSGGKDSAYGALAVSMMVDLEVKENGIEGFFDHFKHLNYQDEVLEIYRSQGEAQALRAIKKNLLTCVYIPTENSSDRTLNAARLLIEGGTLPSGRHVEGIGGKFFIAPVQAALDEITASFVGLDLDAAAQSAANPTTIVKNNLTEHERRDIARAKMLRHVKSYVAGDSDTLPDTISKGLANPLVTWSNAADDITLQNLQARIRLPIPWAVANQENKMPLATSNESEAVLGYTTAAGDMHMGGANPIGGVSKQVITDSLLYFEKRGLVGLFPVPSLRWINAQAPTAELRKAVEGKGEQTDEGDLGFSYKQSAFIEKRLIVDRQLPSAVFLQMKESPLFDRDPMALRDILVRFRKRWESSQFKRVMSPLSPHVGSNVDPHQAVRTTVIADHFSTDLARLTLDVVADASGSHAAFEETSGATLARAKMAAMICEDFREALCQRKGSEIMTRNFWTPFAPLFHDLQRVMGPDRPEQVPVFHADLTAAAKPGGEA